jgi:hypothetical protein
MFEDVYRRSRFNQKAEIIFVCSGKEEKKGKIVI